MIAFETFRFGRAVRRWLTHPPAGSPDSCAYFAELVNNPANPEDAFGAVAAQIPRARIDELFAVISHAALHASTPGSPIHGSALAGSARQLLRDLRNSGAGNPEVARARAAELAHLCPVTHQRTTTTVTRCSLDSRVPHRFHKDRQGYEWTSPCQYVAESGARGGEECGKQSRFDVARVPVCGRHIGLAIEAASRPGAGRVVAVEPYSYTDLPSQWHPAPTDGGGLVDRENEEDL